MRVPPLKKLFISFIKSSDAAAARGRCFCFIYLHWWLHAQITAHFNALSVIKLPYTLMRVQFARQHWLLLLLIVATLSVGNLFEARIASADSIERTYRDNAIWFYSFLKGLRW